MPEVRQLDAFHGDARALWGVNLPDKAGLDARGMLAAAANGKLRALYVVGANPVKTFAADVKDRRLGKLDLLVVQDLFLTETAQLADIVLPAASAYEKNGTMTNTAGEVQLVRKGGDVMGTRTDYDILRILSYQLAQHGLGRAIALRTPEAAFEEIRQSVAGYGISQATLLLGIRASGLPVVQRSSAGRRTQGGDTDGPRCGAELRGAAGRMHGRDGG